MPEFTYEALAPSGTRSQGTLTANSEREAMAMLDGRGLFPVRIAPAQAATQRWSFGGGRIKTRAMATMYAQLADLLHAGVPLLKSLDILEAQNISPALSEVLREVRARVADGTGLAEAMAQHPRAFNELAVSMIRAGQEGGFLEDVLRRIADFTEHQEDLKAKVTGALAYPVFLAVVGFVILIVLVVGFVPQFEKVFQDLDKKGELPALTKGLMAVSHFFIDYWYVLIGGIAGTTFLIRWWKNSADGRHLLDTLRLKLPIVGSIYLNLALSRFTRILGTMLQNGIPILNALRIAKDSTGNVVLSEAIGRSAENIKSGDSLAEPFRTSKQFPRDVVEMVAVGEESNTLERVLIDVSTGLEKRTSRQLELFVRLLEPMMLLVMAGITLLVVAGLLLPIFKMSSTVKQ